MCTCDPSGCVQAAKLIHFNFNFPSLGMSYEIQIQIARNIELMYINRKHSRDIRFRGSHGLRDLENTVEVDNGKL